MNTRSSTTRSNCSLKRLQRVFLGATISLVMTAAVPSLASASVIGGVLDPLGLGGSPSQGSAGSGAPKAGLPGVGTGYTPPLHGNGAHGQGAIGVVDVLPLDQAPLDADPSGSGSGEDVVLGRPVGSHSGGSYHGHITILALLGAELLGVDTNQGESQNGPLEPLQEALLDSICSGSGNSLCIEVLRADSTTTSTGSSNSFKVLGADVGTGGNSISAGVAEANGGISQGGGCQTATGDSSVASANVLGALAADAVESSSTSKACSNGSQSQSNDSKVVNLNGAGLAVPVPGCDDGTPNSEFTALALLISAVCNADDSNGSQAGAPYGVREALTAFVLPLLGPAAKATTGASESRATTPATGGGTPTGGGGDDDGGGGDGRGPGNSPDGSTGPGAGDDGAGDPAANEATSAGPDSLPFTGANLVWMAILAFGLIGAGAALAVAPRTRRRLGTSDFAR